MSETKQTEKDLASMVMENEPQNLRPIEELIANEENTTEQTAGNDTQTSPPNQDETFDPSIHRQDGFGNPIKTANGKYARKRGRKPGSKNTSGNNNNSPGVDETANTQANQLGKVTAETIFTVCTGVFGEEWTPIVDKQSGIDERSNMQIAWSQYYLATGKRDLPPSIIVMVAMLTYSAPRFRHENTRSKFGRLGVGMFNMMKWFKSKLFKSRKPDSEVK